MTLGKIGVAFVDMKSGSESIPELVLQVSCTHKNLLAESSLDLPATILKSAVVARQLDCVEPGKHVDSGSGAPFSKLQSCASTCCREPYTTE